MNKEERESSVCNKADHLHRDVTEVRETRDTENQKTDDVEKDAIETDGVEKDEIETDDVETGHDSSEAPYPTEDVPESPSITVLPRKFV